MPNELLKNKKGIIFGALDENSIAWKTAEKVHEQGGSFVLTNAPVAVIKSKSFINSLIRNVNFIHKNTTIGKTNSIIVPADATSNSDLDNLIDETMKHFNGKIDFVLHSIGMSINVRKGKHYTDLNHDWLTKGWNISAASFHRLMQCLYNKDAMNEWGSIVALSYMAAQRVFPDYNDMADNKAYLESVARSFGYFFGKEKKVRVNTISQSPTPTTAGKGVKGFDGFIDYAEKMSPLGNATAAECANYTVSLFSDLTKKVTLQNLFHDGGFSNVGVSQEVIDSITKK